MEELFGWDVVAASYADQFSDELDATRPLGRNRILQRVITIPERRRGGTVFAFGR